MSGHTDLVWEGDQYDRERKSAARLLTIQSHMDLPPAAVMDLGANVGFFSYGLARAGYSVTAVEPPNEKAYDAALVAEHRQWVQTPDDLPAGAYDYVLALSVLHHMPQWQAMLDHLLVHTRRALFVEVPALSEMHHKWHGSRQSYEMLHDMSNAEIIGAFPDVAGTAYRDLWMVDLT